MRSERSERGFSLLEILVAFSILALSLGVLYKVFSVNLRLAGVSEDYSKAVLVAESRLAEATAVELEEGESQGNIGDRYRWLVSVRTYDPDPDELDIEGLPVTPYQITVKVEWGSDRNPRSLTLTTLRLQRRT